MSLNSKKLVQAAMLLRPQHRRLDHKLHPAQVNKLVQISQEPQPLLYKIHPAIEDLKASYPHPKPLTPIEKLPFSIERTNTGNLPVYVEYNCNHHIRRTVIRKLSGDVDKFCEELSKVVSNHEVRKKVGYVEVPGVHKESVFQWLIRLGF